MTKLFALTLIHLCVLSLAAIADDFRASVSLEWDHSPSSNVTAYAIYVGTNSGVYMITNVVPYTNQWTITGLQLGTTYYFAATSINHLALAEESEFSNELRVDIPLYQPDPTPTPPTNFFVISVSIEKNIGLMLWQVVTNFPLLHYETTDDPYFYRTSIHVKK